MRKLITFLLFTSVTMILSAPRADGPKSTALAAVVSVRSLETPGAVELSWPAVRGVTEYTISASRETPENWHDLGTTDATKYQINELAERTNYYFRIAGNARAGQGKWSGAVVQYSAQTKDFRPALLLPANFRVKKTSAIARSAVPGSQGELVLAWNAVAGAKSYLVQICDSNECGIARRQASSDSRLGQDDSFRDLTSVRGTEHLATGLVSGKVYFFRIMGVDEKGQHGEASLVGANPAP